MTSIKQNIADERQDCKVGFLQNPSFAGDLQDSKSTSGVFFLRLRTTRICSTFLGCARNKQLCFQQCRIRQMSLDACLRLENLPALQLWDCVLETFSHPFAKGNLTRPSGKHHLIMSLLLRLITFQATFQRVHSQPDFTFSRTTWGSFV